MNKNILICDDEPMMIKLVQLSLEEKGYKIFGAVNGEHFRRKIIDFKPSAVVLDLNMMIIQGDEICRYLKNNFKTKDIPVIIFSSSVHGSKRAKDAGADYFVQKSDGIEELEKVIDQIMVGTSNYSNTIND